MPTDSDFVAAATQMAPLWGLRAVAIEVMSHSENVVCAVTRDDGDRVAMRLHRPGYNTIEQLNSEVAWVASLANSGIVVPTPLPTAAGDFYLPAEVAGETRQVGVVGWVDGAPLGGPLETDTNDLVPHYHGIGVIAAQIRTHHATWHSPSGFDRRRWDADGLVGDDPSWGRFWEVARLSAAQRALFAEARARLHAELSALSTAPDMFGLIHADLHLGNLMAHEGTLTVIDFDDSGWGWFPHELAVALHPVLGEDIFDDARSALIAGYRTVHALTENEVALIDTFLTIRCLMILGWLDARPELPVQQHFDSLATQAEQMATAYVER